MFSSLYQNHPKRCNVGDTLRALIFDEEGNEVNPEDVDAEIQWFADGVEISDATAAEYTVLVGDEGVVLSVEVTIGDETYTAETEEVEPAEEPVEELTVTIVSEDEIPTVGELLTAVVTDEDGEVVDAELLHYQWYAGEDAIDESDTAILLVTDEFVGKTLSVEVTDADGNTFKSEPTAEVEAAEVEELTVSIDNPSPKVGDTLTATVVDGDGDEVDVEYAWYIDDEFYADSESITVPAGTEAGTEITLTVTDAAGNTATDTAIVIDALELLSADQVGAKAIAVEANGELSVLDKFTVKKGSTEVTLDGTPVLDGKTATINLVDKIVADAEYTVTLTPADEDDPATSATFVGEKAELDHIEFMTDKLVMKDYHYNEGYTYVKGVDQFGDPVNLSGLTVTPGVGTFKSYDSNTGKITLYDDDYDADKGGTGAYLLVQQVPVYVQYQSGTEVYTANETLVVSTAAYVEHIEFGEIKKDGGNARDDGRLTVTELNSGKYYVELDEVLDNYGNTLSADDLNSQKEVSKTLFVIPGTTGAFYTTGDFGEVGGKTVLWITGGIRKGEMDLAITGAGGETFRFPIEVEDDPFIQSLTVVWPELYQGMTESAELEFSAVDQYENTLSKEDLWNLRPRDTGVATNKIEFTDPNSLTTQTTSISATGKAFFNPIKFDYANKQFHITVNAGLCEAKEVETFTVQTAGMDINTRQITVGALGYAAKIKSALKAGTNTQLVDADLGRESDINFNEKLLFEDANGNEMVRGKSEEYPAYIAITGRAVSETTPKASDSIWENGWYVWSLTDREVKAAAATAAIDYTNGVVAQTDFADSYLDVYATLYVTNDDTTYYKLDGKKFHLTQVTGNPKSFEVINPGGLLYATPTSGDTAEFKVKVTTDQGETYTGAAALTSVVAGNKFVVDKGVVKCGSATEFDGGTSATLQVTVYYGGKEVGTGTVDYSNKTPVPTKVAGGLSVDSKDCGVTGLEPSLTGKGGNTYDNGDFTALSTATYSIGTDGELKIEDANSLGDTLKKSIQDQYGQNMASTGWFLNGSEISDGTAVPSTRNVFEFRNGDISGKFYLTNDTAGKTIAVSKASSSSVDTAAKLNVAVSAATGNGVADTITFEGIDKLTNPLSIEAGDKLVIANGSALETNGNALTLDGALVNNGTFTVSGNNELVVGSTAASTASVENNGTFKVGDDFKIEKKSSMTNKGELQFTANGKTITVDGTLTNEGTVSLVGAGVTTATIKGEGTVVNKSGATLDVPTVAMSLNNSFDNYGTATISASLTGFVKLYTGSTTIANGVCTATITVPKGNTGIISADGTEANTLTIVSTTQDMIGVATNGKTVTINSGVGSTKQGTADAVPVSKKAYAADLSYSSKDLSALLAKVGIAQSDDWWTAQGVNKTSSNVAGLAFAGLDASKHYYIVYSNGTKEELGGINLTDAEGKLVSRSVMQFTGKTKAFNIWTADDFSSGFGAITSFKIYEADEDLDAAIKAAEGVTAVPVTSGTTNYQITGKTFAQLFETLGAKDVTLEYTVAS